MLSSRKHSTTANHGRWSNADFSQYYLIIAFQISYCMFDAFKMQCSALGKLNKVSEENETQYLGRSGKIAERSGKPITVLMQIRQTELTKFPNVRWSQKLGSTSQFLTNLVPGRGLITTAEIGFLSLLRVAYVQSQQASTPTSYSF